MFKLLVLLLLLDIVWLKVFLLPYFTKMIYSIQKEPVVFNMTGAIVAYLALFYIAYTILPIIPNEKEAFLLGFCVYAVYDGTNYATFKDWNPKIAIVDSLWGGILFFMLWKSKSWWNNDLHQL
jgi:uncharacterized membrane protein